ncbi:protein kinase [Neorhizobium sp. CSC1952]|uniref:protein kinase domain-containing protein n=1 Tax=Neorhizobium sp. CSC1952 TaxID=2978974 RepID=UPI0025A64219|nr:protein kinase [Rhizobium sp. CSC1952]WJR68962.1 protein kinase [Rhizobium sp. CSC1952]
MIANEVTRLEKSAKKLAQEKGWGFGKLLGHGASAAVFEVITDDQTAALKIYHPNFLKGNEGVVSRARLDIVREKLLAHACPTLVRTFDCGESEGTVYMLMEHVPGLCLTDALKLVTGDKIEGLVKQVADAAKYLEDLGICHRDIKPDNIVVSADFKKATLLDLGVVRLIDSVEGSGTDDSGQLPFVATARYSSPEYMFRLWQPGPELWRALTFYQLGAVIHDLLAGEQLFEEVVSKGAGNRYLIAHAVAATVPAVPFRSDAPSYLTVLAQRALQKDPKTRLQVVTWDDFTQNRKKQNELLLGIRKSQPSSVAAQSIDVGDLSRYIRNFINKKLTDNRIDCSHKVAFLGKSSFCVSVTWDADLPNQAKLKLQTELTFELKDGTITIHGAARSKEYTAKTAEMTILCTSAEDPSVAEQSYETFLEVSAKVFQCHLDNPGEKTQ